MVAIKLHYCNLEYLTYSALHAIQNLSIDSGDTAKILCRDGSVLLRL